MNEKDVPITVEALLSEQDWLRALARRLVSDEARADDLLQDVWLKVVSSPPRAARSVRAWLTRVMVNRHRDVRRSEGARSVREDASAPRRDDPSAAELVARVDAQQRVAAAVLELEEPLRETVLLRFFEDLSVRAIARRMDAPYETARARLGQGLARLRARLAPEDGRGGRRWSAGFLALAGIGSTGDVAAAAALTGVVLAMKTKLAVAAAVIVLLATGIGGWTFFSTGPDRAAPAPAPDVPRAHPEAPPTHEVASEVQPSSPTPTPGSGAVVPKPPSRGGSCHGRLTFADGRPAAGVEVRLSGTPTQTVTTDAEGRFRIENEWVDALGRSLYVGPTTGLIAVGNVLLRAGEDVEFDAVLRAGRSLRVQVVAGSDGRPLEGVWVVLDPLAKPAFPSALCISDGDGKGGFAGLPARDFRVYVASQGFMPWAARLDLTQHAPPETLRVVLHEPEELRLRFTPPPAGKDIQASVTFLPDPEDPVKGQHNILLSLKDDGTAVGIAPAPGIYRVYVNVYGVVRKAIPKLEVREREPVEITVELDPGAEVRGVLRDAEGRPVRGHVTISPVPSRPGVSAPTASSDEKGAFTLTGVPTGECELDVLIGRQTLFRVVTGLTIGEEGVPDLRVNLPAGRTLRGRIVDSPLPNAHFLSIRRWQDGAWSHASSVGTGLKGGFAAAYLPPGRYHVEAAAFRPEHGWARAVEVVIRADRDPDEISIRWRTNPKVEIRVVDANGDPVTGRANGTAMPEEGASVRWFRTDLDAEGRALIESVPPGRWRLQMTVGKRTAWADVEIRSEENAPVRLRFPD